MQSHSVPLLHSKMKVNRPKFRNSPLAAVILHLLLPGLGHLFWREYLFGIFIFLVILMAGALFVLSLFIDLPLLAELIILGLPMVFYLISFGDLWRTVKKSQIRHPQIARKSWIYFAVAVLFQCFWPLAPVNFAWENAPTIFVMDRNNLAPLFKKGDLLKASRLAYMVRTYVVDKPIFHSLPGRFEVVRFRTQAGDVAGIVVGLPGEEIEVIDGVVTAGGIPQLAPMAANRLINGDWPLTTAGGYSLLIATPNLGRIEHLYEVPITELIGKVEKIL